MFKTINTSFKNCQFSALENIHKHCLCESYAKGIQNLKWVGWIYTSYDPQPFHFDHMLISKDLITGHGVNDKGRKYT